MYIPILYLLLFVRHCYLVRAIRQCQHMCVYLCVIHRLNVLQLNLYSKKPSSNLYLYMYLVTFNVMHCIYNPSIFISHLSLLLSRQIHILLYLIGVFYASSSEIWIFLRYVRACNDVYLQGHIFYDLGIIINGI